MTTHERLPSRTDSPVVGLLMTHLVPQSLISYLIGAYFFSTEICKYQMWLSSYGDLCVFLILNFEHSRVLSFKILSWGSYLFILTKSGCSEYARKCSPGSGAILSLMFVFLHHPVSSFTTISQVPVAPTTGLFISSTHPALSHCCDFVILTPFGMFLPFLYLHIDHSYPPTTR